MENTEIQRNNIIANTAVHTKHRRNKNMLRLAGFFISIAVIVGVVYLLFWSDQQTTDDAYVGGDLVQVTAQVAGEIRKINVSDNVMVHAGDILLQLDDTDAQLNYEKAQNNLRLAILQFKQNKAAKTQADVLITMQQAVLRQARDDYQRRLSLAKGKAISAEELNHAKLKLITSQNEVEVAKAKQLAALVALGQDTSLAKHPSILSAINQLKQSWLNLQRTTIKAPMAGQIAKRNVQIGQRIAFGMPLMLIVPLNRLWVDANFKESQLAKISIGQTAKMTADLYGEKIIYNGVVTGFSAGTGSAFSLLPSQNATGNWIKVVQRVPVRITLDSKQLAQHPLLIGVSMDVKISTKNSVPTTSINPNQNSNSHSIAKNDFSELQKVIDAILANNS